MKLWLLCFVLLFAAAEGIQGFGGWPNLGSSLLWHPLTVLAGIGLAVLSNAEALGLGANRAPAKPKSVNLPPNTVALPLPPSPASTPAAADTQAKGHPATQVNSQGNATTKVSLGGDPLTDPHSVHPKTKGRRRANAKADSISFEIHRSS